MVPGAVKKQQNVRIVRCCSRCEINAVTYVRPGGLPLGQPWNPLMIEMIVGGLKSLFLKILDSHLPLRKVRMRSQTLPWISNDVWKLMRARNNCCALAKKSKKADDWMKY